MVCTGSAPAVTKAAAKNAKRRANKKKGEGGDGGEDDGVQEVTKQLAAAVLQEEGGAPGVCGCLVCWYLCTGNYCHRSTKADTGAAKEVAANWGA